MLGVKVGTSFNIAKESPIILRLTLPETDASRYVRAFVRDQNGVQLAGSPFALTNLGDGRYFFKDEINLKFPVEALEVSALYRIYDDAAFTIPTVDYSFQSEDIFRADVVVDGGDIIIDNEEAIAELRDLVKKVLILGPDIEGELMIDSDSVEAEIESEVNPIVGEIEDGEDIIEVAIESEVEPIDGEIESEVEPIEAEIDEQE